MADVRFALTLIYNTQDRGNSRRDVLLGLTLHPEFDAYSSSDLTALERAVDQLLDARRWRCDDVHLRVRFTQCTVSEHQQNRVLGAVCKGVHMMFIPTAAV